MNKKFKNGLLGLVASTSLLSGCYYNTLRYSSISPAHSERTQQEETEELKGPIELYALSWIYLLMKPETYAYAFGARSFEENKNSEGLDEKINEQD